MELNESLDAIHKTKDAIFSIFQKFNTEYHKRELIGPFITHTYSFFIHLMVFMPPLRFLSNEEQYEKFYARAARGEIIGAYA